MSADLALTLAAIELHVLDVVLLAPRSKRPAADAEGHWPITGCSDEAEEHLARGGNLGLVCGQSSGIAVLDFDQLEAAQQMAAELGALPITVLTGSGKAHVYVRHEDNLPAKLKWRGQKVGEVQRGPRQQVVMPPSVHPDTGRPYTWAVNPLLDFPILPASWRRHLHHHEAAPITTTTNNREVLNVGVLEARALALPGARQRRAGIKFQCPGCAAEGHDKHRDNGLLGLDGRWGCAYAPGDREHRRAIAQALGVLS